MARFTGMSKNILILLLVFIFIAYFNSTTLAYKKKEVTTVSAIYQIDPWVGKMYETFLKEYRLKMPKKIKLHFAESKNEFFALANVKLDLGVVTVQGTIVLSDSKVTSQNRNLLLRELIILTLQENKRAKEKDKIIVEFFKKYGIKIK
ncbi:MAG: hypothetical protein ACK4MM_04505 [Fervidobacterium sp.]